MDLSSVGHVDVRERYRDEDLWVLEKPAGVLSHPNPPHRKASNALLAGVYNFKHESYQLAGREVFLAHRLDQDTSGLLLCAFSLETAERLREALREGRIEKEYCALVLGVPRPPEGEWRDHLRKRSSQRGATVVATSGPVNARTRYRALRTWRTKLALIALEPRTGRTHQLRVQCAKRSCPILGDARYGDFARNREMRKRCGRRMYLHARRLAFEHPVTGRFLEVESETPASFDAAWRAVTGE